MKKYFYLINTIVWVIVAFGDSHDMLVKHLDITEVMSVFVGLMFIAAVSFVAFLKYA